MSRRGLVNTLCIVGAIAAAGVAAWLLDPSGRMVCALVAMVVAMAMMHVATRDILAISYQKRIFDMPDRRRVHKTPVPRLGGTVFTPIIICATILAMALCVAITGQRMPLFTYVVLIVPMALVWMVGVTDDLVGVRWPVKLASQVVAALLVIYSGFRIDDLHGLFGVHAIPAAVAVPLTVLFVASVMNALNLIDGIDGLAAGLCIVMSGVYGARMFGREEYIFAFMAFATLGGVASFYATNVWGYGPRKRKLFMGDAGSLTMGLVMAILATGLMTSSARGDGNIDFVLAFSPLLVPVLDVAHVSISRMRRGASPFLPDKTHIHHRLMNRGLSRHQTVAAILGLTVGFTGLNLLLASYLNMTLVLVVDAAVWIAFNALINNKPTKKYLKMKKVILAAVMAVFALGASAQGFHNVFVSVDGGVNIYSGGGAKAAWATDLSVGNWFSPASGARVQFDMGSAKKWGYNADKKFGFSAIHADYLWNISNTIGGARVDRLWSFVPFVGLGAGFGSPAGKTQTRFAVAGGLLNKVRLSPALDANLEVRAVAVENPFNGVAMGKIKGRTIGSITVGLTYNFGK